VEGSGPLSVGRSVVGFSSFAFEFDALFGGVFQLVETAVAISATVPIDAQIRVGLPHASSSCFERSFIGWSPKSGRHVGVVVATAAAATSWHRFR